MDGKDLFKDIYPLFKDPLKLKDFIKELYGKFYSLGGWGRKARGVEDLSKESLGSSASNITPYLPFRYTPPSEETPISKLVPFFQEQAEKVKKSPLGDFYHLNESLFQDLGLESKALALSILRKKAEEMGNPLNLTGEAKLSFLTKLKDLLLSPESRKNLIKKIYPYLTKGEVDPFIPPVYGHHEEEGAKDWEGREGLNNPSYPVSEEPLYGTSDYLPRKEQAPFSELASSETPKGLERDIVPWESFNQNLRNLLSRWLPSSQVSYEKILPIIKKAVEEGTHGLGELGNILPPGVNPLTEIGNIPEYLRNKQEYGSFFSPAQKYTFQHPEMNYLFQGATTGGYDYPKELEKLSHYEKAKRIWGDKGLEKLVNKHYLTKPENVMKNVPYV